MPKQTKPTPLQLAARLYGCPLEDLLSHRVYPDGSVVIIAPTGQKFAYSAEALLKELAKQSPVPAPGPTAGDEEARSAEEPCLPPTSQSSLFQLENEEPVGINPPKTAADPGAKKLRKPSPTGKSGG